MQIKELIKRLKEVEEIKPDSTIYLRKKGEWTIPDEADFDFTGFGVDDNRDVELYVVAGDKEA